MKLVKKIFSIGVFLFVMFSSFNNVYSQELDKLVDDVQEAILKANKRLPILNNFRFIPSDLVDNPFITSYLKTNIGGGLAVDLKAYLKNLQGEVIDTLSGDLAFVTADMSFQLAVNNWLAFKIKYGGAARLGSNAFTLLTSGVSYTTGYSLGGKIKLWENKNMMLSGSLEYSSNKIALYSIYDFVKSVVEKDTIDGSAKDELLQKDNITSTFLNFNYAYAPTDWCGLLVNTGWGIGSIFKEKTKGNLRIGLATAFDFENINKIGFPIGILLSVKYNSYSESGEKATDVFAYGFRIGYTGHKDFDVGVETIYQSLNFTGSQDRLNTMLYALKLRYYF